MKRVCCGESYQNKGCSPAIDARNNVHQRINNKLIAFGMLPKRQGPINLTTWTERRCRFHEIERQISISKTLTGISNAHLWR